MALNLIFFFCFGAIIGSFLNVISLRMNTGKSVLFGRSACFNCSKKLEWYELIPIFSYLMQGGKCKKCRSAISSQYILVEIITGVLFAAIANIYISNPYEMIFYFIIFSVLIVITIYDLRHMIIPDSLSYLFSFMALGKLFLYPSFHIPDLLWILAGPIIALPFALIWLFSRGKWMGLGDAKLMLGIGWILGLTQGITAVIFAFWIGAIISVLIIMFQKYNNSKRKLSFASEVPFGPFLVIGFLIIFFLHIDIFTILLY